MADFLVIYSKTWKKVTCSSVQSSQLVKYLEDAVVELIRHQLE